MTDSTDPQPITEDLKSKIEARLPDSYQQALAIVIAEAARQGVGIYLVGGFVRDLLLDSPNLDVDIAVEGDAIALARAVAKQLTSTHKASISTTNLKSKREGLSATHPQFGTATVQQDNPLVRLDFATTRRETYAQPAALPTVQPVTDINTDLRRRDFTINALAVRLTDYQLVDPYGGQADLAAKRIRILHDDSFADDPTRILRAVRYEQRLYFTIEDATLQRLKAAMEQGLIDLLTPDRVRHELEKVMREERAPAMLGRLADLAVLAAIDPALHWDEQLRKQAEAVALAESPEQWPSLYLLLLTYRLSETDQLRLSERLNLAAQTRALLVKMRELRSELASLMAAARPSDIYKLLQQFPDVVLLATTYALAPYGPRGITAFSTAIEKIGLYRRELAGVKPELDGRFLTSLGLKPGPRYKAILAELHRAKLDGEVVSREDEAALLRRLAEEKHK